MSALPRPFIPEPAGAAVRRGGLARTRAFAVGARDEWRRASWTVRVSVMCLMLFYLFAAASPVIAPYDPAYQYRDLPDCPPMALHLSHGADRAHGLFFAYPAKMLDPLARRFTDDRSRKTFIRFFYRGH